MITHQLQPGKATSLLQYLFVICFIIISSITAQDTSQIQSSDSLSSDNVILQAMEAPAPVTDLVASDLPNDGGGAIVISWSLSADDNGSHLVAGYQIFRSLSKEGSFEKIGQETRGKASFEDGAVSVNSDYYYHVKAFTIVEDSAGNLVEVLSIAAVTGPAHSSAQWFNGNRGWCLFWVLLVSGSIIFYISKAKSGQDIYVRKIAGIDAVDEALGRATEMGRKVYFIPGIQDMNDVQTIAGIAILGRVAQYAAEYDTYLEVPVCKSLVMVTARETMKEAYSKAGRPDSFNENQVHYLTDDQFGYAAAIDGMVVREKPATIFYMGAFFAESLILAETGNAAGAIQIAGTAMPSQLPFFVAACDYTLIGEELFAASAYLSREPRQLGSLKGQDVGKVIFLLAILIGVTLATFGWYDLSRIFIVK